MTNKEMLIQSLQAFEGEYENCVTCYIRCPYAKSADCLNHKTNAAYGSFEYSENCHECKQEWLLKEADV